MLKITLIKMNNASEVFFIVSSPANAWTNINKLNCTLKCYQ